DVDLDTLLEQGELSEILSHALALLPPDTREVLIQRYTRDSSHAEVAVRLGMSQDAVKKRVERGKSALRHVLSADLRSDALAYGLITVQEDAWQETRIWCPGCGRHKLSGQFRPHAGELKLRCSGCSPSPYAHYLDAHWGDGLRDLQTYKPALSRVLGGIHEMYRVRPVEGAVRCPQCGDQVPIRRGIPPWPPFEGHYLECIYRWCPRCDVWDVETWHALTWSLPAARRFWQEHPRMRFLPEREIEVAGSPAVVTSFESLTDSARLDVVSLRDSLQVVRIAGVTD
ncbi:MAG TPA: RNA polymerase sigma factor, partial [Chloroflexota bacterium]|nr:RNA polymerase sigma factor [Chloroflexota bacterium]